MKGKHASAAERRREHEALEKRADMAEREVRNLTAELAELREKSERQITGLRREVAELIRQRDAAAAPRIQELTQQIEEMRVRLNDVAARKLGFKHAVHSYQRRVYGVLRERGLSDPEISVIWASVGREIRREGYSPAELMAEGGDVLVSSADAEGGE